VDYYSLAKEARFIKEKLEGAVFVRAQQGERGISIRLKKVPFPFLNIVLDADYACFFLSKEPLFKGAGHLSSLMERHIKNARLVDFSHPKGERVFVWRLLYESFTGQKMEYSLIFEVLGKQSNLILCQGERILDAWRRKEGGIEERSIMPARTYFPPEPAKGEFLLDVERERFFDVLSREGTKGIQKHFFPVPRFLAKELESRVGKDPVSSPDELLAAWSAFCELKDELLSPLLWRQDKRIYPFKRGEDSLEANNALSLWIPELLTLKEMESRKSSLRSVISARIKRLTRLKKQLEEEAEGAKDYEKYRLWAETILINLNRIQPKEGEVTLENPYQPGELLRIPLDADAKPSQTAQRYFALYSKLKNKHQHTLNRIAQIQQELDFLEELLWQVEEAPDAETLEDIEELLVSEGYLQKKKREKRKPAREPSHLKLDIEGFRVLVGKNSRANEYVTFKLAEKNDLWFHVKGYPGSHVVVKGKRIPESVIEKAASLAAYFSRARNSSKVDVDYTRIKYVKRMKPARPGAVYYTNYSTITVEPKAPEEVADGKEG